MFKFFCSALVLMLLSEGVSAISYTTLSNQTNTTVGSNVAFEVNVTEISTNTTLSWIVAEENVANLSVTVVDGTIEPGGIEISSSSAMYSAGMEVEGNRVKVTLMIDDIDATFNGKQVKLTDGTTDSIVTLLDVKAVTTAAVTSPTTTVATDPPTTVVTDMTISVVTSSITTASDNMTTKATSSATTAGPSTSPSPLKECGEPSGGYTATCATVNCKAVLKYEILEGAGYARKFACTNTTTCARTDEHSQAAWTVDPENKCKNVCREPETWGKDCTNICGPGCVGGCNETSGRCMREAETGMCTTGYKGIYCNESICDPQDCNGGECVAPGLCTACPHQFAPMTTGTGTSRQTTCRNLRLDGFLKGSLPALAVLMIIVMALTAASKWYIKNKIKEH